MKKRLSDTMAIMLCCFALSVGSPSLAINKDEQDCLAHSDSQSAGNQTAPPLAPPIGGLSAPMPVSEPVRLSVVVLKGFDCKSARIGTPVRCKLLEDLIVNGVRVASSGDEIEGEISKLVPGKRTIKSYIPSKHWLNAQGRLSVEFHKIFTRDQQELEVNAGLRADTDITPAAPEKLHRLVNKDGELTANYHIARYLGMDALVSGAVLATGPVGMIVAPAVTGIAGVVNPSYANGRPLEEGEKTKAYKNFLLGAGRGVPGASLVFGMTTKGINAEIKEGDKLDLELKPNSQIVFLKDIQGRLIPSTGAASNQSSTQAESEGSGSGFKLREQL